MALHPHFRFQMPANYADLTPAEVATLMNGPDGNGLHGTLGEHLGIRFISVDKDRVIATMPVAGNLQPTGRLHGGANLALAEEIASIGSFMNIDPGHQGAVGVDVSATHVRGVSQGYVTGEAHIVHRGRTIHVWNIEIRDEQGRVTSVARCTCNVINLGA